MRKFTPFIQTLRMTIFLLAKLNVTKYLLNVPRKGGFFRRLKSFHA